MRIWEIIKRELNGKEIEGRDGKICKILVVGESSFTIWVKRKDKPNHYGFLEGIRDVGKGLFFSVRADFTRIPDKEVCKKIIKLLSQAMPENTLFLNEIVDVGGKKIS